MASGTFSFSRSGTVMQRRKSIGDHRTEMLPRTTVIPGRGVQTFQTLGEFKLEAVGEPNHEVQYGYVLLGLRK
jgi:hypothetical protein